jgi:hypothetical protein
MIDHGASLVDMSRVYKCLTTVLLTAAIFALPAATVTAATGRNCNSADLRYPFSPGGPKAFGVFKLRIANGTCTTAHRVAKTWMHRFETTLRAGHVVLPRAVSGFTFRTSPAHVPQTYISRGRRGTTTIWFEYRIPNG